MDKLRALARIAEPEFGERALKCATKVISGLDEPPLHEAAVFIYDCFFELRTPLALEIAGALFRLCGDNCQLDVRRKTLKRLVSDLVETFFNDVEELKKVGVLRFGSGVHSLFSSWLALAFLAPMPIDTELVAKGLDYACGVLSIVGPRYAGKVLAAVVARDTGISIEAVPVALRQSVLARLVDQGVSLAPLDVGGAIESIVAANSKSKQSVEAELELLTVMSSDSKYSTEIEARMTSSVNARVTVRAGVCMCKSYRNASLASEYLSRKLPACGNLVVDDALGVFAFLTELARMKNLCAQENWSQIRQFLIRGLRFESAVNPTRGSAIHQQVLQTLWTLARQRLINPRDDLPLFLVELLRIAMWHGEGITRHRANSVLQELVGRYGLHEACDLLPNSEQAASTEPSVTSMSLGELQADRWLPVATHSALGFQGAVLGVIETLLAYEHSHAARHSSTLHFLLEKCVHPQLSVIVDNVVYTLCSDKSVVKVCDPQRWQHAQHLALLSALITVTNYKPSPEASMCLTLLAKALVHSWASVKVSCVPTRAGTIFCPCGEQLSYALRFWQALCVLNPEFFQGCITSRIATILSQHRCAGVKYYEQEWAFAVRSDTPLPDPTSCSVMSTQPTMQLLRTLPVMLLQAHRAPHVFFSSPGIAEFIESQNVSMLQSCIPIALIVTFIDFCGLAASISPTIYADRVKPILLKGLHHPEGVVKAVCREWLDGASRSTAHWRLRDRLVRRRATGWRDVLGDVETCVLRPFTCPTFWTPVEIPLEVGRTTEQIHLLGTTNCAVQAKCLALDWGRGSVAAVDDLRSRVQGPWDRRGCLYAAALSYVRGHKSPGPRGPRAVSNAPAIKVSRTVRDPDDLLELLVSGVGPPGAAVECYDVGALAVSLGILRRKNNE